MDKRFISQIFTLCFFSLVAFSCKQEPTVSQFTLEGVINNASERVLYLEKGSATILDSLLLDESGSYQLSAASPSSSDFYRLRLGKQIIHFVVDSTETITINADAGSFARNYEITGSPENQYIKELVQLQQDAQAGYRKLQKMYENKEILADHYVQSVRETVERYKSAAKQYIGRDLTSSSAYFALFQQIDNMLIFDPNNREDSRFFGALANNYPDSVRREYVKSIYLTGLATIRGERDIVVNETTAKELFDFSLPGLKGNEVKLSEIGEGKITLIDFTLYGTEESPARNIALAGLYTEYKDKGFEIYQVSFDADRHAWYNAASNLPWVTVRDPESIYSGNLTKFNVTSLPTVFIRDRDGGIIARPSTLDEVKVILKKHLR